MPESPLESPAAPCSRCRASSGTLHPRLPRKYPSRGPARAAAATSVTVGASWRTRWSAWCPCGGAWRPCRSDIMTTTTPPLPPPWPPRGWPSPRREPLPEVADRRWWAKSDDGDHRGCIPGTDRHQSWRRFGWKPVPGIRKTGKIVTQQVYFWKSQFN